MSDIAVVHLPNTTNMFPNGRVTRTLKVRFGPRDSMNALEGLLGQFFAGVLYCVRADDDDATVTRTRSNAARKYRIECTVDASVVERFEHWCAANDYPCEQ